MEERALARVFSKELLRALGGSAGWGMFAVAMAAGPGRPTKY